MQDKMQAIEIEVIPSAVQAKVLLGPNDDDIHTFYFDTRGDAELTAATNTLRQLVEMRVKRRVASWIAE